MTAKVDKTVSINAVPATVWKYLTDPNLMKEWMGDPEMNVEVITDWMQGNPIRIKVFHHVHFENKGIVLQFDPYNIIQYTHFNSISQLPAVKENFSTITFLLTPEMEKTILTVKVEDFPTEIIYNHLKLYWEGTVVLLKKFIEDSHS